MKTKNLAVENFISLVKFDAKGLIAGITQDYKTNEVLMLAWLNEESLRLSLQKMEMVYFSRSRQKLWAKGEESGHTQKIKQIYIDCDGDALVAKVEQIGGIACHTGRKSCFYTKFEANCETGNFPKAKVIKDPKKIYKS